eukprot:CAMPEP_0177769274 /NCGR_PEP_ID=MMETSP0491_2-20121128/10223_1 /TAXON_ID=63592 /ORGANISM="Tetraselmis chuii, Strain PLY429" /LENGTH=262 /DNA_ID=CAMNT_0019286249 /DNA_START=198 /DNA_END=986 /DNA_ORIENTATION=+
MKKLADPTERAWRSKTWRPLWAQPPAGQRLRENCERATALLYEVAYQQHHLFTASEEINPKILSRCKGLVFTFTYQAGVGIKFSRGTGLLIRKQPTVDPGGMWSKVEWSAPVPLETTGAGIGVTLGGNEHGTIYALLSDEPLKKLHSESGDMTGKQPALNFQGSLSISGLDLSNKKAAWSFDRTANHLMVGQRPIDVVTFRLSNGMMLDMSVATSSLGLDMEEMEKCYDGLHSFADLMDAETPEYAEPLYDAIDKVMKQEMD